MPPTVKRDLRGARRADTEARLVGAATELFVDRGYAATTLVDVAARAGVAERTVYVRFATKAALLDRCLDVAIRGGDGDTPVPQGDAFAEAMSARTRAARIRAMARLSAQLMRRAGPLLEVAHQASAVEPTIAARAQAAREQTQGAIEGFWRAMAADGLLGRRPDLEWLAPTAAMVGQPDSYVLLVRTTGWDPDAYESWLVATWTRLAVAAGSASPRPLAS